MYDGRAPINLIEARDIVNISVPLKATDITPVTYCRSCERQLPVQVHACWHCGKERPQRFIDLPQ